MSELDIETLKRLVKDMDNPTIGMDSHRAAVANFASERHAIIAALEDRERLRVALDEILTANESDLRQIARAALEGHV